VAVAGLAAGQVLGRTAGSRVQERRARLPGDDVVAAPTIVTNHAVTIEARAEQVWPWLTQVGWHRGGWYTPRWVDRLLFPANRPSADHLDPELVRDLRVGDTIPDGREGTAHFVVAQAQAPGLLVLHSTTHVPRAWADRQGARIDWTWTFTLTPSGRDRTRLLIRTRARTAPWWLTAGYALALVPADYVMGKGMLSGIKRRVESHSVEPPVEPTVEPDVEPDVGPAEGHDR
jgi:hypothetical protein